ncbi:hypothetical protein FGRMN_2334 [Fusarium graminum]|nr:hypothetical protein FGRMN_2334 [Fusarium graminum]
MADLDVDQRNGMGDVHEINQDFYTNEMNIGINASGQVPANLIIPEHTVTPSQTLLTEIFQAVGIQKQHAIECWDMMERTITDCALKSNTFLGQGNRAYRSLRSSMKRALSLQETTDRPVSLPAPNLAVGIAVFYCRKPMPFEYVSPPQRNFVRVFEEMKVMQWLPVAIKVFEKTKFYPFIIELDQQVEEPIIRQEDWHGDRVWVVRTKRPESNIYEAMIRNAIGITATGSEGMSMVKEPHAHDQPLPSIEEPGPGDELLPPMEGTEPVAVKPTPVDSTNQYNNSNTLREYAREMRRLGKRLATPDRETIKRVRKGLRRFADHADRKDNDMESERRLIEFDRKIMLNSESLLATTPQVQKALDVYGHYKVL